MVAQSTFASLSQEQYFIRLWPFPDRTSQLFIHLGNTTYTKYQQHAMEKSIKNVVQSQPSTCKPQYFYKWLSHCCLYFSQQNQRLKSHVLSLPQLARNTKFARLCPRGREQPPGMSHLHPLSCSTSPTAVRMEGCCILIPQFQEGIGALWWTAGEHNFL